MSRFSCVLLLCAFCCASFAFEINQESAIVLPEKPTTFEKQAAEDFNRIFKRVSGIELPIKSEPESGLTTVHIGKTLLANKLDIYEIGMAPEEIRIRANNRAVALYGGDQGGVIFAVYEFFRRYAGCEWYDGWTVKIPQQKSITVPNNASFRQKPAFEFRKIFTTASGADWREKDAIKAVNGTDWNTTLVLGLPGFVHNFIYYSRYWPKDKLELFAMDEHGKRMPPSSSMGPNFCLSNPECAKRVEDQLRAWIKQEEKEAAAKGVTPPYYYFIDANDCTQYYCLCPECKKEADEYGFSGQLIRFLNPIAKSIAADYPRVRIGTNAYTFARQVPKKTVIPEKNMNIRLCRTVGEYYRPITEDRISDFMQNFDQWSEIAPMLSIWDYWVFFWDDFPAPYTNVRHVAKDLRYYRDKGVKALFIESEAWDTSNFFSLRWWLGYRLMVDPSADDRQLVRDFMQGFYGKGGKYIEAYLDYLTKRQAEIPAENSYAIFRQNEKLKTRTYLDAEFFSTSNGLFEQAEKAAAGDDSALKNIRRERMIVDCAMLHLWTKLGLPGDYSAALARYEAEQREHIEYRVAEKSREAALKVLNSRLGKFKNAEVIVEQMRKPLPTMAVPKAEDWNGGTAIKDWFEFQGYPSKAPLTMEMRHDGSTLYFRLRESNVTRKLEATEHIWDGDECEIMLSAQEDKKEFLHVLIGAEGKTNVYIHEDNDRLDAQEITDFKISASLKDKVWTVEAAIPLAKIPGSGNVLYGNFFRSSNNALSAQCWSPVFGNSFPLREFFGKIVLK